MWLQGWKGSLGFRFENPTVPPKYIEYGVYGDRIIMYPKPYFIHLRGTVRYLGSGKLFRSTACPVQRGDISLQG